MSGSRPEGGSGGSKGNPRRVRVAQAMRVALAELIEREIDDPRLSAAGLVSLNKVELSRDMGIAWVYVSFIGGEAEAEEGALAALAAAARRLRGPVARRINLARAPELRFVSDPGPAMAARITDIVREDALRGSEGGEEE
jgi:ribosome-binding factor A